MLAPAGEEHPEAGDSGFRFLSRACGLLGCGSDLLKGTPKLFGSCRRLRYPGGELLGRGAEAFGGFRLLGVLLGVRGGTLELFFDPCRGLWGLGAAEPARWPFFSERPISVSASTS